jgi:hypothetical protein
MMMMMMMMVMMMMTTDHDSAKNPLLPSDLCWI